MFNQRINFSCKGSRTTIVRKEFIGRKNAAMVTVKTYPIVWNQPSSSRGGHKVQLAKNSATFTDPVHALWHHDFSKPLASTSNGSMRILPADDYGQPIEIDLDTRTTAGRDAAAYVTGTKKNPPLVTGMSFSMSKGYEDYEDNLREDEEGDSLVTVKKFTTDECTFTCIPAFGGTTVEQVETPGDDEDPDYEEAEDAEEAEEEKSGSEPVTYPNRVAAANKLRIARIHNLTI